MQISTYRSSDKRLQRPGEVSNQSWSVNVQFTEGLVDWCECRSLRLVEVERLSTAVTKQVLTKLLSHDDLFVLLYRHTRPPALNPYTTTTINVKTYNNNVQAATLPKIPWFCGMVQPYGQRSTMVTMILQSLTIVNHG